MDLGKLNFIDCLGMDGPGKTVPMFHNSFNVWEIEKPILEILKYASVSLITTFNVSFMDFFSS